MGVGLTPCIIPAVGKATFTLENDEMEVGLGTQYVTNNIIDTQSML